MTTPEAEFGVLRVVISRMLRSSIFFFRTVMWGEKGRQIFKGGVDTASFGCCPQLETAVTGALLEWRVRSIEKSHD